MEAAEAWVKEWAGVMEAEEDRVKEDKGSVWNSGIRDLIQL